MSDILQHKISILDSAGVELRSLLNSPDNKTTLIELKTEARKLLQTITLTIGRDPNPNIKVVDKFIEQMMETLKQARLLINNKAEQAYTILNNYLTALTENRRKKLMSSPVPFLGDIILLNLEIDRIQKILTDIKDNTYIQFELDVIAQLTKLINEEV